MEWYTGKNGQNGWQSVIGTDTLEQAVLKAVEEPGSSFLDDNALAMHIGRTVRTWLRLGGKLNRHKYVPRIAIRKSRKEKQIRAHGALWRGNCLVRLSRDINRRKI